MTVLTQITHWVQQAFASLYGLSMVSIILILVAAFVGLRILGRLLRVVVPLLVLVGSCFYTCYMSYDLSPHNHRGTVRLSSLLNTNLAWWLDR